MQNRDIGVYFLPPATCVLYSRLSVHFMRLSNSLSSITDAPIEINLGFGDTAKSY